MEASAPHSPFIGCSRRAAFGWRMRTLPPERGRGHTCGRAGTPRRASGARRRCLPRIFPFDAFFGGPVRSTPRTARARLSHPKPSPQALQPPARKKRRTWCACSAPPATAAMAGLGARPEHPAPFTSSPPPARRAARARLRVSMHSGPVRGWMTPSRRAGVSSSTSMRVERRGVGVNDADASESSIRVLKTAPAARPFWGREVWG